MPTNKFKTMKNNRLKIILAILFFSLFSQTSFSQVTENQIKTIVADSIKKVVPTIAEMKKTDSIAPIKKLNFGCGFGLNFVGGTSINVAPNLIYKVNDKFSFGGGLQASYSAIKNLQNTTTFGGNMLANFNPTKSILTLLELSELNVNSTNESTATPTKRNFWDTALFIGAGYNITPKISLGAKYNMLYKEGESVYTTAIVPFVNIGF